MGGNFALGNSVCAGFHNIIGFGDDVRYEYIYPAVGVEFSHLSAETNSVYGYSGWRNACFAEEEKRGGGDKGRDVLHKTLS